MCSLYVSAPGGCRPQTPAKGLPPLDPAWGEFIDLGVSLFIAVSIASAVAVVASAATMRSGPFAAFLAVLFTIHLLALTALEPRFGRLEPIAWYLQAATTIHFGLLVRARLRGLSYRAAISIPAHFWMAGMFLACPWAIAAAAGLRPLGWWLPFVGAAFGVLQSLRARAELVELTLSGAALDSRVRRSPDARRFPLRRAPAASGDRVLRVVQITDPHLGPFMSEDRLRGICERAVAEDPDLVLLTGDFFTMEGSGTSRSLARALEPLSALTGRVHACRGNHDLEVPEIVAADLAAVGARLLIDEAETVACPIGPVQIVGLDHIWRHRREHFGRVLGGIPRGDAVLRIVLLHDPGGFVHLPEGEADLVLAGHTHGGHIGLVSLGLDWTTIGGLSRVPDHGFWSRGTDRLYVHRANGHYGFPLRIGVPAEESVLRLVLDSNSMG